MEPHIFSVTELVATPWKNGGGVTREIVCQPPGAGMEAFDWRVSIAHIASDGPFSGFAGVDRVITLLEGSGVRLRSADGAIAHQLDTPLAPFAFPGEATMHAELLAGDCHDLNVMTRRSKCRAHVQVVRTTCALPAAVQGLLVAVRGRWHASRRKGNTQALSTPQGLWWHAVPIAWQLQSDDADAALLAVLIHPVTPMTALPLRGVEAA